MKVNVSWRGGQEKTPTSLQFLVKALNEPRPTIDAYASTCAIL